MLALLLALSVAPESYGVPRETAKEISRLEAQLSRSEEGRRLLAETARVERRAAHLSPLSDPVARRAEPPAILLDLDRLKELTEAEFQLLYARELARAALGLPPDLLEGELAARQRQLLVALELAAVDKDLSRGLKKFALAEPSTSPAPPARTELGRVARGLWLAARGAEELYDWIERTLPCDEERVALYELEDYEARRGTETITGRRRRRAVGRLAARLRPSGGLRRARESLGDFETRGAAELTRRARLWLKSRS